MIDQRETLNIAYNPMGRGRLQQQQRPQHPRKQKPSVPRPERFHPDRPTSASAADSANYHKTLSIVVSQKELPAIQSPREPGIYQADWLAVEDQDITDRGFYDHDADEAFSYTCQAVQVQVVGAPKLVTSPGGIREAEQVREVSSIRKPRDTRIIVKEDVEFFMALRNGLLSPLPATLGTPRMASLPAIVEQEKSSGRSSTESACQDLFAGQEDVDFFISLLGGSEPPHLSSETETFMYQGARARKQSEEAAAQEAEKRRLEELAALKTDLNFLDALMQ